MKSTRDEKAVSVQKRYFDALKLIHGTLKYTDKINISAIIEDFNLSKSVYTPLKDGGIITTNGMVGRGCKYKWIGKEPNLDMAIELYRRLNNTDKRPNERKGKEPSKRNENKSEINHRYLLGLSDVYNTLQYTNKMSINKVISAHRLSRQMTPEMQALGMISREVGSDTTNHYKWITSKPTIEMAIELRESINKTTLNVNKKSKVGMKTEIKEILTKVKEHKPLPTTRKSYFWGLYVVETVG